MSVEREAFERAAIFRQSLARYLGLPPGKDPEGIAITLGPTDSSPLIAMPLDTAEKLLREATVAREALSAEALKIEPGPGAEAVAGKALLGLMGREATLIVREGPPVVGLVERLIDEPERDSFVVIGTEEHGPVEVFLRVIVEVRA